jgi:hypothetical protein
MKNFGFAFFAILLFSFFALCQNKTTGGVRGKVRMPDGDAIAGVMVQAQQNDKQIATARTDAKGDFTIVNLPPGVYDFVFTKEGLSQGTLPRVEVKAGTIFKLSKLVMAADQGKLAILRGSVFDSNGRSVSGARVEIFREGETKKIAQIFSSDSGEFTFRLPSNAARYRIAVTIGGRMRGSKEIEINGAEIYRTAVSLN